DFDNPMQRSRKWQRRFFVLYEHGCLRFALDESPSTLPQGTVNMNLCTDVIDAEPKTGQKNSLCIITPEQEFFIRGESKEIINGWSEQLIVYPRTNKQNQKKKRKVEPATSQEPGPAKVAVTGSGIPETDTSPDSSCIIWQEELSQREQPSGSPLPPAGEENRSFHSKLEALELENQERMEVEELGAGGVRQGRSEHRHLYREVTQLHTFIQFNWKQPQIRADFIDNVSASVFLFFSFMQLCFEWLNCLLQWKKYWFVLTDHSLRYYKDSIAEEASDLDGEIDLTTCYNVTEYQAQRNYGFQIHTQEGVHTLSAMTAGIRRNWIQAVMKNVRPSNAPDVASSTEDYGSFSPLEGLCRPDVTQDSPASEASSIERESAPALIKSRARERRREGRSKTFDWAEFRPIAQALAQQRAQEAESLQTDGGELERGRRREERRKRYECVASSDQAHITEGGRTDPESGDGVVQTDSAGLVSMERQQKVEEAIEQHWRQVEKTPIREERRVPLPGTGSSNETTELELLLEGYKLGEVELQLRMALEREQDVRTGYISPATCERGFAAMEESHQKVIEELQRKHQRELENLQEEKERLLAEETAATIAAIEAMKNAHRTELEKELDKAQSLIVFSSPIMLLRFREELCSFQREIEVLSEQYSQKCLENAHLAQALEAERQALRQCQRENQELNAHNQELNNRLAAEIRNMRSMTSEEGAGDSNTTIHGKELYELEVMLRVKESEVQYLKQEINSLKEELQASQRDKKYATDKYKDIYTELSIVKAKAERDVGRLREQLQLAHEALGEPSPEDVERGGYDIMKSKSNPDILKMAAAAAKRSERTMRSKVGEEQPFVRDLKQNRCFFGLRGHCHAGFLFTKCVRHSKTIM
uniref:Myosin phosphatase Rho interacting protein n=1 Tax=Nothobranchius furzeri TaxID=105023 RepID=A0A8C6KX97_NOTFU